MKIRRTPWWQYVVALLLGLIAGCLLVQVSESSGLSLLGAPWFVSVVLLLLGIVVLVMALQVHQYATTDPQKRARLKPLDPTKAVYTLMLSKALGLTGAALAGWYVGQILLVLDHIEAGLLCDGRDAMRRRRCDMPGGHGDRYRRRMAVPAAAHGGPGEPQDEGRQTPPRHRLRHRQNPPLSPFPLAGGAA